MDRPIDVSFIIPVHNHGDHLRRLLASLAHGLSSELRYEIIVVDDASTEDLSGVCKEFGACHVRIGENRGPAYARNEGAAASSGALLFFLDADVIYATNAAEKAWRLLTEQRPDAIAVSFMHQPFRKGDSAVANFGAATEHYWASALFDGADADVAEECGFASRAGVVRREAFDAIRGFDVNYKTNAHEDYDFGKRLMAYGTVLITREPLIHHDYPGRLSRVIRNVWVRVNLFIPYYLTHKPGFLRTQVSPGEARIRLAGGFGFPIATLLALMPSPVRPALIVAAAACLAYYLAGIAPFLRKAYEWSQSPVFTVQCVFIYGISSAVTTFASGVALIRYFLGKRATPLRSPVH